MHRVDVIEHAPPLLDRRARMQAANSVVGGCDGGDYRNEQDYRAHGIAPRLPRSLFPDCIALRRPSTCAREANFPPARNPLQRCDIVDSNGLSPQSDEAKGL